LLFSPLYFRPVFFTIGKQISERIRRKQKKGKINPACLTEHHHPLHITGRKIGPKKLKESSSQKKKIIPPLKDEKN